MERRRKGVDVKAVVLASGELDSTVTAALAKREGHELYFLTVAYGQRHGIEVKRARHVARAMGVSKHIVLEMDLRAIGGSALTSDQPVPKDRTEVREGEQHSFNLCAREKHHLLGVGAWLCRDDRCVIGVPRGQCSRLLGISRLPAGIFNRLRRGRQIGYSRRCGRQGHRHSGAAVIPIQSGHHSIRGFIGCAVPLDP